MYMNLQTNTPEDNINQNKWRIKYYIKGNKKVTSRSDCF